MTKFTRDIIVIGASAGGIEACVNLLKLLPADFSASVFVVVHLSPNSPSVLPKILGRHSKIEVKTPVDEEEIQPGKVYVGLADQHLIVKPGIVKLGRGPRENGSRPSVDVLFRTAAYSYGERVVGVVLSGSLSDGTAGLMAIKAGGGLAIVQTPDEAIFGGMPQSALDYVDVDFELPLASIALELIRLAATPLTRRSDGAMSTSDLQPVSSSTNGISTRGVTKSQNNSQPGLTCPDCGGAVWENTLDRYREYRCLVGHSFSPDSMLTEKVKAVDASFWKALRLLEENIQLRKKILETAIEQGHQLFALEQQKQIQIAETQADFIRKAANFDISKLGELDEQT
jgi:two-component system chemotaxis response regulator CheB